MQKTFTILLLAVTMCYSLCGCNAAATAETDEAATDEPDAQVYIDSEDDESSAPLYNSEIDYMNLMVVYAGIGNVRALEAAIAARNAKIEDQGLDCEPITKEKFLSNYEQYSGFALDVDYLSIMEQSCLNRDYTAGRDAESKRNLKIDTLGLDCPKIYFDDLLELARVITAEAGSSWLPIEWKMMVGEVVLNRVASMEFPDTIYDVIHQYGQYSTANLGYFSSMTPFEDCVTAAARLLSGERLINDISVVFQSGGRQGSGTCIELYDSYYGYTYLCYSNHPEYYE